MINLEICATFGVTKHLYRSMDAIAHWIRLGLLCGPLERDELPEHIRVSPVGEADKPNGRARVTVDMSWPHLENPDIWSTTVPCSPNASVDQTQYNTEMVTSLDVLRALHREGSEGYISKADWADAYKHIPIRMEDRAMQVFRIGDR